MENEIQKSMHDLLKLINFFRKHAFEHEALDEFEKDIQRFNKELENRSPPKNSDQLRLTRIVLFRAVEDAMISALMKQTDPEHNKILNVEKKKYSLDLYKKFQRAKESLGTANEKTYIPVKSMGKLIRDYREATNELHGAYPEAEVRAKDAEPAPETRAKASSHRKKRPTHRVIELDPPQESNQESNLENLRKEEAELKEKLLYESSQLKHLNELYHSVTTEVSKNYLSDPLIRSEMDEIKKNFESFNLAIKERNQLQNEIKLAQGGPLPSPDAPRVIVTPLQAYNKLIKNAKDLLTKFEHIKSKVKYSTERIYLHLGELDNSQNSLQNLRAELKTRHTQFSNLATEINSFIEAHPPSLVDNVATVKTYLEKHRSLAKEFIELTNQQDDLVNPDNVILLESERLPIQSEKLQKNIIELQDLKTKIVENLVDLNKAIQEAEETRKAEAKVAQVNVDLNIIRINALISKLENTAPYNREHTEFIAISKASLDKYRAEYSTSKPFKNSEQSIEEIQNGSAQALNNLQVISNNIEDTVKTKREQFLAEVDALVPQVNKLIADGNISEDEVALLNSKYLKLKGLKDNLSEIHHYSLSPSNIVALDEELLGELKGDMKDLASKLNERSLRAKSLEIILINRLISLLENEIKEIKQSNEDDARLTIFNLIVEQINQDKANYLELKNTPIINNALTIINNNLTDENLNQLTSSDISLVAVFLTNLLQSIMEFLGVAEKKTYNTRFFMKNSDKSVAKLDEQGAYQQLSARVREMEDQIKSSPNQP